MALILETWLKKTALEVQEYVRLCAAAFRGVFTRPFYRYDFIEQLDAIGIQSLTVVLLTGFFTGAVLALQSGLTLDQFGARPVVGRLVSASMIKELGPVLTGLMLTGRVGSGIAASWVDGRHRQINALRALGTDPIASWWSHGCSRILMAPLSQSWPISSASSAAGSSPVSAPGDHRRLLVVHLEALYMQDIGWASSSRSCWASSS